MKDYTIILTVRVRKKRWLDLFGMAMEKKFDVQSNDPQAMVLTDTAREIDRALAALTNPLSN